MEGESPRRHTNTEGSSTNFNEEKEFNVPTIFVEEHDTKHDSSVTPATEENKSSDAKLEASTKFHKTRRRSRSSSGVELKDDEKETLGVNYRRRSSTLSGSLNFKGGLIPDDDSLYPQLNIDKGATGRRGSYSRGKEYGDTLRRKSIKFPLPLRRSSSVAPAPEENESLDVGQKTNKSRRRSNSFGGGLNLKAGWEKDSLDVNPQSYNYRRRSSVLSSLSFRSGDNDSLDPRLDIDNVRQVGGATVRPSTYYRAKEYGKSIQRKSVNLPTSFKLFKFHIRDEIKKLIQDGMTLEEIAEEHPGWVDIINEYWKVSLEAKVQQLSDIDSLSDFNEDYVNYKKKVGQEPSSNLKNDHQEKEADQAFRLQKLSVKRRVGVKAIKLSDEEEKDVTRWQHSRKNIRVEKKWSVKPTLYERIIAATLVEKNASLSDTENKNQAKNATKLLLRLSSVPLSKFWQKFTEIFAILVFITGVCVAIADIWISPVYLYYKVPALVLGLIETFVLFVMWVITKLPRFKNHPDPQTLAKKQQYIENITHEVLLLVLLIMTVVGFSTEKMYNQPSNAFGWIQLILLLIDIADVMWTQIVRVFMMFKFVSDIQEVLEDDEGRVTAVKVEIVEKIEAKSIKRKSEHSKPALNGNKKVIEKDEEKSNKRKSKAALNGSKQQVKVEEENKEKLPYGLKRCWLSMKHRNWKFAGGLLARAFFSGIGNMIIFLYLLFMFGVQTHKDNFDSSDYHLTVYSSIQIVCLCLFPFYSLILFFLVNLYWVMEILISVNCYIGKNKAFQDTLSENYGAIISDSLGFAAKNYENSQMKLDKIKSLSSRQKLTYGLGEMKIVFLIFLWQLGIFLITFTFNGFDDSVDNIIVSGVFIGLCVIFNAHIFLLMIILNILLPFILLGLIFYPFTVTILYKPRYKVTQTVIEEEEGILTDVG